MLVFMREKVLRRRELTWQLSLSRRFLSGKDGVGVVRHGWNLEKKSSLFDECVVGVTYVSERR
jgi:hypothetical protein